MRIKFQGGEADHHRLEAYEGIKSLEGLIRVSRIASHYAATDEVRFRAPYTPLLEAQISQIVNGSFEMLFDYASRIADRVGADEAKTKAEALFNFLVRRGTGQTDEEDVSINGLLIPSGDVAAMGEAAESGLKAAHRWISETGKTISVIDGDDLTVLDTGTKSYVEEEEIGDRTTRDVSVAAMNVNSKNGRVFLRDDQRTTRLSPTRMYAFRPVDPLTLALYPPLKGSGNGVDIFLAGARRRGADFHDGYYSPVLDSVAL